MIFEIDNLPSPIEFEGLGEMERTVRNCKNLLMTKMGEVPYDRYRGFDPALYHLSVGQLNQRLLRELDRVMLWEPEAEVVWAKASLLPDGRTLIRAGIRVMEDDD